MTRLIDTTRRSPIGRATPPTPMSRIRGPVWLGLILIAAFLVGGTAWAVWAPLQSAVLAPGVIQVESQRKTVQHLEGGIVAAILVRDGQTVEAGEVLIRLDRTKADATLAVLRSQMGDALARQARLQAERQGLPLVIYPNELTKQGDPEIRKIMAGQEAIFRSRRDLLRSRQDLIQQRINQAREQITGQRAQEVAIRKRMALLDREVTALRPLVRDRLERLPRLLEMERNLAAAQGELGAILAQVAEIEQNINQFRLSVLDLDHEMQNQVATELRDTEQLIAELRERIETTTDVLARTEIRAPQSGTVTALRIHTPGGVVASGEPLLDLVPQGDRLVVKAYIRPDDIDVIHPGLPARIRLTAYKQRRTPTVDGRLIYVSADHLVREGSGESYYDAVVEIDPDSLKGLAEVSLVPGMSAQVMINTKAWTTAEYLMAPLLDTFEQSFRED